MRRADRVDHTVEGSTIVKQKNESLERLFMQCWHPKEPTWNKAEESQIKTMRCVSDQAAGDAQTIDPSCELL